MKDTRSLHKAHTGTESHAATEISRVATTAIGIIAGIIGIWAVACIISGITNSGGPVNLISNLFKAISG
ncbi:MAG: hypothetical protein K9K37_07330 [Desulfocapsa sp.]|nr:hypothetical protein [Desulfocapsa sp.]